jgi:alpha-tubulin suppressor-like RCC1 family protein
VRFWAFLALLAGCDRLLRLDDIFPKDAGVAPAWTTVSAGGNHTCGIRTDGSLWCWGDNFYGQVALGTDPEVDTPGHVGEAKWSAISAGDLHTCGLQVDGSLWCWGYSSDGEIGIGFINYAVTVPEPAAVGGSWQSVSAGGRHTCAMRGDGTLWCWGSNSDGQLGTGASTFLLQPSPVQVTTAAPWSQVASGNVHTCAIDAAGSLFCWGAGSSGQLGDGTVNDHTVPMQVSSDAWTKVATGYNFTCGITNGHLRCWGAGLSNTPQAILMSGVDTSGWIDVSTGSVAGLYPITCALRADGSEWCFGDNRRGVLGSLAAPTMTEEPVQSHAGPATFTVVAVGATHACSVASDQTLWCIGGDGVGQLGDGYGSHRSPTQVAGTWTTSVAGYGATCALDDQGSAACSGGNNFGQLGDTTNDDRQTFAKIAASASFTQLALGADTVLALTAGGELWSWGEGYYGELGNGTSGGNVSTPQVADASHTWTQLAATLHGCGIDATHSIYCWGNNQSGELGTGSTTAQPGQPTPVMTTITTWNAVATGISHTCAIAANGAYCWGSGNSGGLGNNMKANYSTPQTVISGAEFTAITCGNNQSCAIDTGGQAWCWGDGNYGQLGVGGLGNVLLPQPIPGRLWRELSAGYSHTCGIQSDGTLWCWGLNSTGQLGDGTLQSRDTPTPTGDSKDNTWTHVSAGQLHTCATKADHSLWCWGANAYGQLGDGTAWRSQAFQVP